MTSLPGGGVTFGYDILTHFGQRITRPVIGNINHQKKLGAGIVITRPSLSYKSRLV